ncbi:hypothetical protein C480_08678 [Natrialba aegyptia DSM 13077]|uniref:Uncharacterized protein n=1 Tax=Natrialba aegyptia DSM 13077 TaxID=1227491 RepID=M0B800_9EURY|nr:hypothetical protein C480_08678 [Natrialba aegyptia DSM 13077]
MISRCIRKPTVTPLGADRRVPVPDRRDARESKRTRADASRRVAVARGGPRTERLIESRSESYSDPDTERKLKRPPNRRRITTPTASRSSTASVPIAIQPTVIGATSHDFGAARGRSRVNKTPRSASLRDDPYVV